MDQEIEDDLTFLVNTPLLLWQHLQALPQSTLHIRVDPDSFSAVEQVCHLRDVEREAYAVRLTRMLSEVTPELKDFDGARVASERAYNHQNPSDAFEAFARAREKNVSTFSTLDKSLFERTGMLEGVGEITVRDLVSMMREHDEGHLAELNILRRQFGRPEVNETSV